MMGSILVATEDDKDNRWDLHPHPTPDAKAMDVAMLPSPWAASARAILTHWSLQEQV